MRRGILALTALLAVMGCGRGWQRTDDAVLRECWGATSQSDGVYELRFEAIVLVGTEGGTYALSRSCTDYRLNFGQIDPTPARQFDPIEEAAWQLRDHLFAIRGVAVVSRLERRHEHLLVVRIRQFPRLETATPAEARRFAHEFNLD